MKTFLAKSIAVWGLVALVSGRAASGAAPPYYKVTDLGTLPGASSSEALALNDRGQVIGVCSTGVQGKAFLWDKGVIRPLPLLPGFGSLRPHAINNQGQIVGTAFGPDLDTRRAFLIDKGIIQDLGTPAGEYTEATGLNDQGQAVGKSYTQAVNNKGQRQITLSYTFLWSKATGFRRLTPHTNDFGENVSAISNTGQVIGSSWTLGTAEERLKRAALPLDKQPIQSSYLPYAAFLWQNGQTRSLSPPQSWSSGAIALNGRGDILGSMSVYPEANEFLTSTEDPAKILDVMRHSHHVFLWRNGQSRDLGEIAEQWGMARAFNDADDIVGYAARQGQPEYRAFLWRAGNRYMLTDLISPTAGWFLEKAVGINNHGQIIGVGIHNALRHAFLLTPR